MARYSATKALHRCFIFCTLTLMNVSWVTLAQESDGSSTEKPALRRRRHYRQWNDIREGIQFVEQYQEMVFQSFKDSQQPTQESSLQKNQTQMEPDSITQEPAPSELSSFAFRLDTTEADCTLPEVYSVALFPVNIYNEMENVMVSPHRANVIVCDEKVCLDMKYVLPSGTAINGIDIGVDDEEPMISFLSPSSSASTTAPDNVEGIFSQQEFKTCVDADNTTRFSILRNLSKLHLKIKALYFPEGVLIGKLTHEFSHP